MTILETHIMRADNEDELSTRLNNFMRDINLQHKDLIDIKFTQSESSNSFRIHFAVMIIYKYEKE